MNAGLGNLDVLRKFLLADSLAGENRFDAKIKAIGLGMAGMMDQSCNRKFAFADDDTATFDVMRTHFYLPRYPISEISKVEQRDVSGGDWYDLGAVAGVIVNRDEEKGWISFGWLRGIQTSLLRVTYSGGYWFETLEPDDEGYPSAAPVGVAVLPDEVKTAWLLQCQEVWNKMDKLGAGLTDGPDKQSSLDKLELVPLVKQMLKQHVRYQIT
jgi:hypothetical protein